MPSPLPAPVVGDSGDAAPILPDIAFDPASALRISEIEVEVLGTVFVVPAMSAADWLDILWGLPDPEVIFPGLVGGEQFIYTAMLEGRFTDQQCFDVAMDILELASGFRWWTAYKTAGLVQAGWFRLSWMMPSRPDEVSLGAFLSSFLGAAIEKMEPKNAVDLVTELNEAPEGYEEELDEEAEGRAFLAAMHQAL